MNHQHLGPLQYSVDEEGMTCTLCYSCWQLNSVCSENQPDANHLTDVPSKPYPMMWKTKMTQQKMKVRTHNTIRRFCMHRPDPDSAIVQSVASTRRYAVVEESPFEVKAGATHANPR